MCGIHGKITTNHRFLQNLLVNGHSIQGYRGPDAQGTKIDKINNWYIGLAHQRLSILDLSETGNQPMLYQDNKGIIVYNGEVYNYKEIRDELEREGFSFKGDSDTEVILTALHNWGIEISLNKFNGMWAFAWLNSEENKLYLARDRFGIKPLYYYCNDNELLFSSEIKTILEMSSSRFKLNYQIVGEYLIQSQLDTRNSTFFEGINKIPPSHYLEIDLNNEELTIKESIHNYWSLISRLDSYKTINEVQMVEEIQRLFFDSVNLCLRSDVPVGVLLSGGIDSSAIATVMNQILGQDADLNLLSAVSSNQSFDESPFIDRMGNYLNRNVHKVVLNFTPHEAMNLLETVTWHNDEPVGSFSNVAHLLLMKQAKELGVTVILSGQGADELLCGYKKYLGFYIQYLINNNQYFKALDVLNQFRKRGTIINQFSFSEAKRYLPSIMKSKEIDIRGVALKEFSPIQLGLNKGMSLQERQILDIQRFSVPVLTHYEDRMSMAFSREVRVPFLDYRLVELLVSLPTDLKLQNGWTKAIFRKAMEPYLPKEIVWRKDKQGFVNPQSEWLKFELKQKVLELFERDSCIFKYGIVDRNSLLNKYNAYCKQSLGKGNIWFRDIFNPLALEVWLRKYKKYIS